MKCIFLLLEFKRSKYTANGSCFLLLLMCLSAKIPRNAAELQRAGDMHYLEKPWIKPFVSAEQMSPPITRPR